MKEYTVNVSELKCFGQVSDIIGKAQAEIELSKVLSVFKECNFQDEKCVSESFVWLDTPQGYLFWVDIENGVNPYDRKED